MERRELLKRIETLIADIQTNSGRSMQEVDESTDFFSDLEGFDSLNFIELITSIEVEFNLPSIDYLPLLEGRKDKKLTIKILMDRIAALLREKEGTGDE